MALIKCKECGHDVSDKASVCPNCGCPIEKGTNHVSNEPVKNSKTKLWFLLALLLCLIIGGGYYAYNKLFNGGNGKDAIVEFTPKFVNAIQQYEKLGSFSEGLAAVMRDGKWGYINTKGDEVIPCQFTNPSEYYSASPFYEGLALIQENGKCGFINTKGEIVIPIKIEAETIGRFSEGLAFVYESDEDFSVINKGGKTIFSGKCINFYEYYREDFQESLLPSYSKGQLFVPISYDKYVVYDKKGNKVKEMNLEISDELDKLNEMKPYTIFSKVNGDDEEYQYNTVGLKDANGTELIPAIYDGIENVGVGERIDAPNGVMLVVLDEIGDDAVEGYGGEFDSPDTKHHYGYVDLKGNDTFSKEIKERCQNSKERAIQKIKKDAEEARKHPDWLKGTWTANAIIMGKTHLAKLVIEGNYATFYSDYDVLDKGEYELYDGKLNFGSTYFYIDERRQLVKFDDNHYFSHSSQPTTSVNVGTPEQNNELKIMTRLRELNNKSIELTNELARMRNSGNMDPTRYLYIKQTVLNNKEEQISLARQLGDNQLVYEYQQQKQKLEQAYRMMDSGY